MVEQRKKYHEAVVRAIRARKQKPSIVFLDPDTGLEPESGNFNSTHVTKTEIQSIWKALRDRDVLVFCQHQDNRRGEEWIERKKTQLASALKVDEALVKTAHAPGIAKDVAFYFVRKPES